MYEKKGNCDDFYRKFKEEIKANNNVNKMIVECSYLIDGPAEPLNAKEDLRNSYAQKNKIPLPRKIS